MIITVLMPMRRSSAKRSLMPPLTMSLSSITPSTRPLSATTSGVLPRRATSSTSASTCAGISPPRANTCLRMASAEPLRIWWPGRSTPLMRVWAEKCTKAAPMACRSRARISNCCLASTTMLRPSGVSSASEANCATSASSRFCTPGAGRNSAAWRLPSVMVPVLSISSTSTSPAASTARPEVAITLACIMRLMPATPMADNRPAMVVGIRHTSSATSTVTPTGRPTPAACTANTEYGNSVTVTARKTMVSATSRMVKAISLGVFWRLAPSTMAIMRSTKVSPGLTETCTTIQSDSTRVPPVTAEKSPPDSRTTGADSPVMALSSTEATPSMTTPSAGTTSPACTSTTSPLQSSPDSMGYQTASCRGASSFLAQVSFLRPRSDAACALLRPSAKASAKFANSTVNQSHSAIARMKDGGASPWPAQA